VNSYAVVSIDQFKSDAHTLLSLREPDLVIAKADSLLLTDISDLDRAEALFFKGKAMQQLQQDIQAISIYRSITALGLSSKTEILGDVYFQLGEIYYDQGSFKLAQKSYLEALKLFRIHENESRIGAVDLKVGMIYLSLFDYEHALQSLEGAREIYEASESKIELAEIYLMMGKIYFDQADFKSAESHLLKAESFYSELGFDTSQNEVMDQLVAVYQTLHRYSDAIGLLEGAVERCKIKRNYKGAIDYLQQKAWFYTKLSDSKSAIHQLEIAVALAEDHRQKDLPEIQLNIGELYGQNGQSTEALFALTDARDWAKKFDDFAQQRNAEIALADFFQEENDWETAFGHLQQADSLNILIASNRYSHLQVQLSRQRMDEMQIIEEHFDEVAVLKTEQSELVKRLMIGGIIALVFLVFFLYREFIQKRQLSKILEWKVYRRTRELRKSNKELNTYIYKSSHDLRTPLTSIKSLLRLLHTEEHTPTTRKYLGLIDNCTDQMDDILISLSRAVDYKKVEPTVEKIDFNKVKYDLEQKISAESRDIKITWNINEKAPFFSDYKLLKVILRKTIANALTYRQGEYDDFCEVTITTDRQGAILSIEDNGQGINEKIRESVFDMFVKGTHKSKGAGLGLYLVKIALDKIKGKVVLESTLGKGSKLTFQLPNMN
jgi:signal transduction histidine kinase